MQGIDHLVYTVADLATGINEIEALLGVRPVSGGRHPDFGTHNALLSLGPNVYLELIAPDPSLKVPDRGLPFGMGDMTRSHIATWACRSESIKDQVANAKQAGIFLGKIESGSRQKPDGSMLSWKLTDPNMMLLDGAVPFLISWGDTAHPAGNVPRAGMLVGLRIEHPKADRVRDTLAVFGVKVNVQQARKVKIVAIIETDSGVLEIS